MSDAENKVDDAETRITIRVLFFGAARETAGRDETKLSIQSPATVASAFEEISTVFPQLGARFGKSLLCAHNQEYAPPERNVVAGDEMAIFPPVSGGADEDDFEREYPHDFFELQTGPIDVNSVARRVVLPGCGATVTLDGYVREFTGERRTLYLVYECYAPMALKELYRLGRDAHDQFDIAYIGVVHRTGRLEIGETSVVISVGAAHRRAAFGACEWAIRQLKRTVPIWKKEFFEGGEVWAEGEQNAPAV